MADRDLELKIQALVEGSKDIQQLKDHLRELSGTRVQDPTREARQGIRQSERAARGLGDASRVATRALGALGLAISASQMVRFAVQTLEATDALQNAANVADLTTDSVQELRYTFGALAELTDSQVDASLRRFARRLGLARQEAGPAKAAFEEMFGGVEQFETTEQALDAVLERLASMQDQAQRSAQASAFFGEDAGPLLAAALGRGAEGIDQMREKAHELGLVLDEDLIKGAADANTEIREIRQLINAQFAEIVVENADAIRDLAGAVGTLASLAASGASEFADLGQQLGYLAASATGNVTELDKLERQIKDIDRALAGRMSRPIKYLFTSEEDLRAERERLEAERQALLGDAGGPQAPPPPTVPPGSDGAGAAGADDDDADKRAQQIQAIIDKLREQQATYGQSAQATALYRLEQLGASEAELAQAQAIAEGIEQQRQAEQAQKDAAAAARRRAEEVERNAQADADLVEQLEEEINLLGLSNREQAQAAAVARLSADATDEQRKAIEELAGQLYDLRQGSRDTGEEMNQFAVQAARNMQSAFADFLFDPFDEGIEGMVAGFADALRRMIAEALAAQALQAFFSAVGMPGVGAGVGASVQHSGGMAGSGPTRQVSPALFWGAPRYHSGGVAGLAPDEVPAILQRGERVLSREEVARQGRGEGNGIGGTSGRLQVELGDGLVGRLIRSPEGEQAMIDLVRRNRNAFRQAMS